CEADPQTVCRNSGASYDEAAGIYKIEVLGEEYSVDPAGRTVTNSSDPARKHEYFIGLSTPIYLVKAKDIPPSGEMVKELKGGDFFFRGSHTLPLDAIAQKYARDRELFILAGKRFGGRPAGIGDASFTFNVFPRVVMAFALWLEDEEFEARASLLFDSNAGRHMALDVVWAMALVACQRMLDFTSSRTG
ncbi:MAG: DUF3786 domain-containing protein, partial [Nitrospirota bacterium]